jgi:hypothetical protein
MALPLLVSVGGVLIRTTAKQLPKLLRRFKGAKPIENPSQSQIMQAGRLNKNYTNFSKKSQKILGKADTANPSFLQRITGRGRTPTQKDMKPDPASTTGEAKRAATINKALGAIGATAVVGGSGVLAYTKSKASDTEAVKNSRERIKTLEADLKKSESEKKAAQTSAAIEREIRKIMTAESKVKPRPRPEERSGNSRGGLTKIGHTDYRKTGLFK